MKQNSWTSDLHSGSKLAKISEHWRPCDDFRALNAFSIPDRYPLLHNEDCVFSLDGKVICSTIDLNRA